MNSTADVTIEKLVYGGQGLAKLPSGQTVFIPGVLPGEQVTIAIRRKRKGILEADLTSINSPSNNRVSPPCEGEKQCTGATWVHIAYPAQLAFKQEILLETLKRIGGLEPQKPLPILPSPSTEHYRLRSQFSVRSINGKQRIGFFRQGSYDLVEVENVFLLHPVINRTLHALRTLTEELPQLTEIHINASPSAEVHILFFSEANAYPSMNEVFSHLTKSVPEIIGLTGFLGKQRAFALGNNQLGLHVQDLAFKVTEGNFFQINWDQNMNVVKIVQEFAALSGKELVLDLYCGIGNFSLPLARKSRSVIGIESGFSAIKDAQANALLNGISNVEFIADDMQKGMKILLQRKLRAEVVVLDPPRAGATLKTLERVLACVPQKIVYVSCNPATLARDLKYFHLFGFHLDRLQPVDMFPHTYHIECVAEMVRSS